MKNQSPIEHIFQDIFGYLPKKSGEAYEKLSAIALFLLESGDVIHNDRMRGSFSKTLYELDIHLKNDRVALMGEAKDYSLKGKKVGRGDLQKIAGALPDLEQIDRGTFFSATGFTVPAIKYAQASSDITKGKSIDLFEMRPSIELDEQGFIKTIIIKIHLQIPCPEKGSFTPLFTEKAKKQLIPDEKISFPFKMHLEHFYDHTGKVILSTYELTTKGYGEIDSSTQCAHGCYLLKGHHIYINNNLVEIHGLEYKVPFIFEDRVIKITDDSKNRFSIVDSNGNVVRVITDELLRKFSFDDNGRLIKQEIIRPKSIEKF